MAQFAIWQKVVAFTQPLLSASRAVDPVHPSEEQLTSLNETWHDVLGHFNVLSVASVAQPNLNEAFEYIHEAIEHASEALRRRAEEPQGNSTSSETEEAIHNVTQATSLIYNEGIKYVCENFKLEVDTEDENVAPAEQIFQMFQVVYIYFFCFAGLVLVVLSILFLIGKRRKLRGELIGAGIRFFAGIALMCLAAMSHNYPDEDPNDALHNYMYSGVVLPTVLIVYLIVLVVDNLLVRYVKSVVHWRLHLHHHKNIPTVERPDLAAKEAPASPSAVQQQHSRPVSPIQETRPASPGRTEPATQEIKPAH